MQIFLSELERSDRVIIEVASTMVDPHLVYELNQLTSRDDKILRLLKTLRQLQGEPDAFLATFDRNMLTNARASDLPCIPFEMLKHMDDIVRYVLTHGKQLVE